MNEQDWTTEDRPEPWDSSYYQTGRTKPPKSHSGLIAVLLALVIFLGGIASVLGLLNIRLFRQVNENTKPEGDTDLCFSQDQDPTQESSVPIQEGTAPPTKTQDTDITLPISTTPQSVENVPQEGGLSLQDIYTKAIDSVVSISCSLANGSSTGTGVVFSRDGYIVTNAHVVENAVKVNVLFSDGTTLPASAVGTDTVSDIAVLYVEGATAPAAEFGDSGALRVGDTVVAIGDPLGIELRGTMTDGIVSAINRDITTGGRTMTLIQTNAALNSGNSGGPLLNCYGQVIGINTMKIGDYMNNSGVEGLGFAIPSTTVKQIVDQLIRQGYVSGRPTLGITGQVVSGFETLYYGIPMGIYITGVDPDSDAAAKGIQAGDILLQLDGNRIADADALENALYAHDAGDSVSIVIYRSGRQYTLDITLDEAN